MIPNNAFTPQPVISAFRPPKDEIYQPLTSKSRGGIALNNPTQGRDYQNWVVSYDGSNILVAPQGGATAFTLAVPNVNPYLRTSCPIFLGVRFFQEL